MARVTVQDAVDKIGNRFDLIQLAARHEHVKCKQAVRIHWFLKKTTSTQ